jgi:hypothetical protein
MSQLERDTIVRCACTDLLHQVVVSRWRLPNGEPELVLEVLLPALSLRERLRIVCELLRGREPSVAEVLLTPESAERLAGALLYAEEYWLRSEGEIHGSETR